MHRRAATPAADPDVSCAEGLLDGVYGGDLQSQVCDARMLLRRVHQDVRFRCMLRVHNEIELQTRRVAHCCDRFRPNRSPGEGKAEMFIKRARAGQIVHANADMREAMHECAEGHEIRSLTSEGLRWKLAQPAKTVVEKRKLRTTQARQRRDSSSPQVTCR